MKVKHSIWLLIGTFFITTGTPLVANGIDLLGWIIIFYTGYKIFISEEFKILWNA